MSKHADHTLFPIRELVQRTGVNASTLRAWENRHGLLRPHRAESGHRLYGQAEVLRVQRVQELVAQGLNLSEIAGLLATDVRSGPPAAPVQTPPRAVAGEEFSAWQGYLEETLRALEDFSSERLDALYNEACAVYPIDLLTRRLLIPVLERLGARWESRPSGIAEEHFFSAWLRNKLGARLHHTSGLPKGRPLILACLPGESHEIGLLLFALGALHRGYRLVYLGANLPIRQLAEVAARSYAVGIVLAGREPPDAEQVLADLAWLATEVRVPVCVGSHFSVRERDALMRDKLVPLGDDIVLGLDLLEARIAKTARNPARAA